MRSGDILRAALDSFEEEQQSSELELSLLKEAGASIDSPPLPPPGSIEEELRKMAKELRAVVNSHNSNTIKGPSGPEKYAKLLVAEAGLEELRKYIIS